MTSPLEPEARPAAASGLEATFPLLEANGVTFFQDDACEALEATVGHFSNGSPPGSCQRVEPPVAAFDETARSVWNDLHAAFADAGAEDLLWAAMSLDRQGHIWEATFAFDCERSGCDAMLIYDRPGYAPDDLDAGPGATTIPISDTWVWHEEEE